MLTRSLTQSPKREGDSRSSGSDFVVLFEMATTALAALRSQGGGARSAWTSVLLLEERKERRDGGEGRRRRRRAPIGTGVRVLLA